MEHIPKEFRTQLAAQGWLQHYYSNDEEQTAAGRTALIGFAKDTNNISNESLVEIVNVPCKGPMQGLATSVLCQRIMLGTYHGPLVMDAPWAGSYITINKDYWASHGGFDGDHVLTGAKIVGDHVMHDARVEGKEALNYATLIGACAGNKLNISGDDSCQGINIQGYAAGCNIRINGRGAGAGAYFRGMFAGYNASFGDKSGCKMTFDGQGAGKKIRFDNMDNRRYLRYINNE